MRNFEKISQIHPSALSFAHFHSMMFASWLLFGANIPFAMDKVFPPKSELWQSLVMTISLIVAIENIEIGIYTHTYFRVMRNSLSCIEWIMTENDVSFGFKVLLFAYWRGHCYRITEEREWLFNKVTHCSHIVSFQRHFASLNDGWIVWSMHETKNGYLVLYVSFSFLILFFGFDIFWVEMRIQWIDEFTHRAHEFCQFTYLWRCILTIEYIDRLNTIGISMILLQFVLYILIVTNKFNMVFINIYWKPMRKKHIEIRFCFSNSCWRLESFILSCCLCVKINDWTATKQLTDSVISVFFLNNKQIVSFFFCLVIVSFLHYLKVSVNKLIFGHFFCLTLLQNDRLFAERGYTVHILFQFFQYSIHWLYFVV